VKYREVARKLSALGCREIPRKGGGSHRKWFNPATNRSTVVPDWGGDDLKLGTVPWCVNWGSTGPLSTPLDLPPPHVSLARFAGMEAGRTP
jgi:predicted RNA binding protein YcfA (HicA-like mRNA interferase family)